MNEKSRRVTMTVFGVLISGFSVGMFNFSAFGIHLFQVFAHGISIYISCGYGTFHSRLNLLMLIFIIHGYLKHRFQKNEHYENLKSAA